MPRSSDRKLSIRAAEPGDFAAIRRIFSGRSAYSDTLQLPFPSRELWRKRLSQGDESHHALVATMGNEIVGSLGLSRLTRARRSHVGQIGMGVADTWQGKGVGTALMRAAIDLADNWLGLKRLELTVFTGNARAIRLYRKFGFEIEGTHVAFALRDGEYVDAFAMARVIDGPKSTKPRTKSRKSKSVG